MSSRHRPPIDPEQFRRTMGRFTSGVTVVTTIDGEQVHGMTANGFLSVSLDPPLVLVSLARRSRMAALLRRTGRYGVSVLADDQQLHSQHFAGRPVPGLRPRFEQVDGTAYLQGSIGRIGCDVLEIHPAGDHLLHLGQVTHLADTDRAPLVFFTGSYHALHAESGDEIFTY
ncbi:flavin reductase family protein [Amycolatopsis acidiphila]|uniref:Flavin reductase n=1 Tax=Amycolatopsis acidiphila TaxID=715473 RepID=A0A558AE59_9PSEU|nr:flavin reductase family protein [Amycolatopsis acidiphila]TVT22550.1 flavin reductase [Amycolatopsis acidiphila]UIJ58814.1 flavin reductase family protein [Amycolatopsis acidiphila]GHG72139.1 flavin oxidoreductase [Amycolatopsis acidiphila]